MNKTRLLGMLILFVSITSIGCSHFISNPQVTRLQINNSPDRANAFIIKIDDPRQKSMEVHLSENNAIQLDLKCFQSNESSLEFKPKNIFNDSLSYLSPLIVWKYRF